MNQNIILQNLNLFNLDYLYMMSMLIAKLYFKNQNKN